jgi:hypothetical protein
MAASGLKITDDGSIRKSIFENLDETERMADRN